ncbi:C40 family peptidase [Alicyclobacillus sp. SO9]|nr:C40 family peptidase [Alicyclobacillus sp. SO9]
MYPTETVRFVHITFAGGGKGGSVGALASEAKASVGVFAGAVGTAGVAGTAGAVGTAGVAAAATGSQTGSNQYVETNHGWVSYHSAPRLNSPVLGKLHLGDKAPLVQKADKWWYEIRWHNRNVYITTDSKYTHVATIGGTKGSAATGGTAATAATNSTQQYVEANHGWVSYHSQAKLNSPVLGRLQLGDKAPLIKKVNKWWYEIRWHGRNVYITTDSKYTHVVTSGTGQGTQTGTTGTSKTVSVPKSIQQPVPATPPQTTGSARIQLPPPGVQWDPSITPKAGRNASIQAKTNAVLSVAQSKLGTKYIWGHNEDRGQYGFDCSNYTEYVYHHALGYKFTTSSRGQYRYVGKTVPQSAMKPGDLLIFEKGKHVGIYAGNNRMIQEGGGLGKCGYLGLGANSYWAKHMTAVRRMY